MGLKYVKIKLDTLEDLGRAEKLQAQGWKVIQSNIASDTILLEKPEHKKRGSYANKNYFN